MKLYHWLAMLPLLAISFALGFLVIYALSWCFR